MFKGLVVLKRYPLAWFITWFVVLFVLPAPLVLLLHMGLDAPLEKIVIYDLGTICYVWWLISVALSARPSWLDRRIGLPEIYFIHGFLGVLALGAGTIHVFNTKTPKAIVYWTGQIAWYLAIFGLLYAIFFLSGWLVDRMPIARGIKQRVTRILKHQVSVRIHQLHFVVIGLILVHVHVITKIASIPGFLIVIDAYTVFAVGTYLWAKAVVNESKRRRGYVLSNTPLNRDTHQLVIRLDEQAPGYEPGDFYFLSFRGTTAISPEPHPFSATYTPAVEATNLEAFTHHPKTTPHTRLLTFTIRELGDFTQHISKVPIDTTVQLEGPFGRFNRVLRDDSPTQRLVLIGMGTGIAPILSLALGYAAIRPVTIFHTVHTEDDFYYVDQFEALQEAHEETVYHRKIHRYTPEAIAELMGEDLSCARYVIVGGASAVLKMHHVLVGLGVPAHHIVDERLTM